MRAKRAKLGVPPRLEALEPRLALVARLTPLPDNPGLFTLQIDLSQHPRGGDGLPDAVYVSRSGGDVEVALVGRPPEVLFRGAADAVVGVELLGSADVEYVLVADRAGPPLAFAGGADDVLVQIGERVAVPDPVEAPPPGDVLDEDPPPAPFLAVDQTADPLFGPGFVVLSVSTAAPYAAETERPPDEEERLLVPPEMLGGGPAEEPLDVRRLTGGSHVDPMPAALPEFEEAEAEEEPAADDEEPPADP
jgi:hypothetical protein